MGLGELVDVLARELPVVAADGLIQGGIAQHRLRGRTQVGRRIGIVGRPFKRLPGHHALAERQAPGVEVQTQGAENLQLQRRRRPAGFGHVAAQRGIGGPGLLRWRGVNGGWLVALAFRTRRRIGRLLRRALHRARDRLVELEEQLGRQVRTARPGGVIELE